MKKIAALVAASLMAVSTGAVAAPANPAAALSLQPKVTAARVGARTGAKSKQVEASTLLIAAAAIGGAVLFYTQVIDNNSASN